MNRPSGYWAAMAKQLHTLISTYPLTAFGFPAYMTLVVLYLVESGMPLW